MMDNEPTLQNQLIYLHIPGSVHQLFQAGLKLHSGKDNQVLEQV